MPSILDTGKLTRRIALPLFVQMKTSLTIILLLAVRIAFGQLPIGVWDAGLLYGKAFNWLEFEQVPSEAIQASVYKQLFEFDSTNYVADDLEMFVRKHKENIHFVDLDADGELDVIYDGIAGGYESGFVDVYRSVEGTLRLVQRGHGRVCNLDLGSGEIRVQLYPCCDQKLNIITRWSLNRSTWRLAVSDEIDVFVGRDSYMGDSILPPSMNASLPLLIRKESTLHWSPDPLDNDILQVCENPETNIILTLPPGAIGEVLWTSKACGWDFVRIFNTQGLQNYCKGWDRTMEQARTVNTLGWIEK